MTVPVELAHHLANISSGSPFLPASFYFALNNQSYLTLSVKDLNFQSWCILLSLRGISLAFSNLPYIIFLYNAPFTLSKFDYIRKCVYSISDAALHNHAVL